MIVALAWICFAPWPGFGPPYTATGFFRDFLPFKEVVVRREGIRLHSIFYYDDVLTAWLGNGGRMRVKYDPRDLSCVFLEDAEGRHWPVRYRDLARPPITLARTNGTACLYA